MIILVVGAVPKIGTAGNDQDVVDNGTDDNHGTDNNNCTDVACNVPTTGNINDTHNTKDPTILKNHIIIKTHPITPNINPPKTTGTRVIFNTSL